MVNGPSPTLKQAWAMWKPWETIRAHPLGVEYSWYRGWVEQLTQPHHAWEDAPTKSFLCVPLCEWHFSSCWQNAWRKQQWEERLTLLAVSERSPHCCREGTKEQSSSPHSRQEADRGEYWGHHLSFPLLITQPPTFRRDHPLSVKSLWKQPTDAARVQLTNLLGDYKSSQVDDKD